MCIFIGESIRHVSRKNVYLLSQARHFCASKLVVLEFEQRLLSISWTIPCSSHPPLSSFDLLFFFPFSMSSILYWMHCNCEFSLIYAETKLNVMAQISTRVPSNVPINVPWQAAENLAQFWLVLWPVQWSEFLGIIWTDWFLGDDPTFRQSINCQ